MGKPKVPTFVAECSVCDYRCCKQSLFDKHKLTRKHIINANSRDVTLPSEQTDRRVLSSQNGTFEKFPELSSTDFVTVGDDSILPSEQTDHRILSSRNVTFEKFPELSPNNFMTVITQLLNQNNELKNFIIEQASEHKKETFDIVNKVLSEHKKDTADIVTRVFEQTARVLETVKPTINNTDNKSFNINLYLNEKCKDAMNFTDFINNIQVSREDLENNAQLGFVNGISKIIVDNLKGLAVNERPLHCTDLKRETMYIKDDDKWVKEENFAKLNRAIQMITCKSISTLMGWKSENPDYKDADSKFSSKCIVIQQQSMACHNRDIYYPKVIHAIARETFVNK